MAVLVIDGTGRGHALCDLFVRTDPNLTVYYGPGCDVIEHPRIRVVPSIRLDDPATVLEFLRTHPVEFTFVSYIDALAGGVVDVLRAAGHAVIGPTAAAAELESSKARGKEFCVRHGIPVPEHQAFADPAAAKDYIVSRPYPCVVKADGLTPDGDGSIVCANTAEALGAVDRHAAMGRSPLVVEERLTGPEISVFALLDGRTAMAFPPAMDYKRTGVGDTGTNCDGMGSIAPHPADGPELRAELAATLTAPLIRGLRAESLDFTGFVYLGAVLTARGPVVIEINARFGDSEAEVILPGVRENFTELCRAVLAGTLADRPVRHDGRARCSVALVQGGVPDQDGRMVPGWPFGRFITGQPVSGLAVMDGAGDATVYYANIRRDAAGRPVTSGGRVLHVVGTGANLDQAHAAAYLHAARITFPGVRYRDDIGLVTGEDVTMAVESEVRSYSRSFPAVFATASGDHLVAGDGRRYLDFLSGAGTLNYGHNPAFIKRALMEYLASDGVTHGLDLATTAKQDFLAALHTFVLAPRDLEYRVQFCGPTGTNAVESALKLARLVTGRMNVIAFGGAFHGVSTGSLAATGAASYKKGLYPTLSSVTHVPFPVSPFGSFDSLELLEHLVADPNSGVEKPAAVILETVQAEGGVYLAPPEFLTGLREWCDRHQVLLIVDDIQAGCGRTGPFFSFERARVVPDIVTLSKSISGYGLPMAIVLIRPEYDVWQPGQHNGTFRGNQLAFVSATAALREYWAGERGARFTDAIEAKGALVARRLAPVVADHGATLRGTGLLWGLDLTDTGMSAAKVSSRCFDLGLVVETCGRGGQVLKILPPLTIEERVLCDGIDVLTEAVHDVAAEDVRCPA